MSDKRDSILSKEKIDEAFDMMAMGGLDPTPLSFYIDFRSAKEYAESKGKKLNELTTEERERFIIDN